MLSKSLIKADGQKYYVKKGDDITHHLKASFKVLQKYDYRPPVFNESKSYTRNALKIGQQYPS